MTVLNVLSLALTDMAAPNRMFMSDTSFKRKKEKSSIKTKRDGYRKDSENLNNANVDRFLTNSPASDLIADILFITSSARRPARNWKLLPY